MNNTIKYVGCDAHKHYSIFAEMDTQGVIIRTKRIEHERPRIRHYLKSLPPGCEIAIETVGNWYWLVDDIENAGHIPKLTHARKAKLMLGQINKTDKLSATGLAKLLWTGTLPTVWIASKDVRDKRELCRYRVVLSRIRTKIKNRVHATLNRYGIKIEGISDLFGKKGRELLDIAIKQLPEYTRQCTILQLALLDKVIEQINSIEDMIERIVEQTDDMKLLMTIPGIGYILAATITFEVGTIERFPTSHHFASYCGLVPTVSSSGGKTFHGRTRSDVNRYLKWAYVEAANIIVRHQKFLESTHVVDLYRRIRHKKGHNIAIVAVARFLAEATYGILKNKKEYYEPKDFTGSSSHQ